MDPAIVEAYTTMALQFKCSVDDILETPEYRERFLSATRQRLGELPERDLLHRLVYLRKRSRLPRSRHE